MSRHHPHRTGGTRRKKTPAAAQKSKLWGLGFAPWLGVVGMLVGLALGLYWHRTLIPMQVGGILGVLLGASIDWFIGRK
ncbi:MAG: hypothetical protein ABII82_01095 [Verrucomicrobiota bacterium]